MCDFLWLLFSAAKKEAVLFGSKVQCDKITSKAGIDVEGTVVLLSEITKFLCVTLDSAVTMDRHVSEDTQLQLLHTCLSHI